MASKLGAYPDVFKFYEDGKNRRYNLLFAVNGGVLAIAKFFPSPGGSFLSELTLRQVAAGMIAFTILMGIDICVFGIRMREAGEDTGAGPGKGIFSLWGRGVLAVICALMALAWLAVALSPGASSAS